MSTSKSDNLRRRKGPSKFAERIWCHNIDFAARRLSSNAHFGVLIEMPLVLRSQGWLEWRAIPSYYIRHGKELFICAQTHQRHRDVIINTLDNPRLRVYNPNLYTLARGLGVLDQSVHNSALLYPKLARTKSVDLFPDSTRSGYPPRRVNRPSPFETPILSPSSKQEP